MTAEYAIGIDIGGTNTCLGLANRRGEITEQHLLPTVGHATVDDYIAAMRTAIEQMIHSAGGHEHITGIGIGAPNGNYYTGEIMDAPNLPWRGAIPLAKLMKEAYGYTTVLTNDANASAVGEMMYGRARGMKDFIMVTLGTGVGSGFVANGELLYGHDGFAGELGHTIAMRGGRPCPCGRNGCMERYCSATGIVITARELLNDNSDSSLLRDYGDTLTAKHIQLAAEQGDNIALKTFDYTAQVLGESLANAVAITSPQAIIFFGGLAKAGDLLLKPTKKYMEENLLFVFKNKVELLPSSLPDADAALLGASALAW